METEIWKDIPDYEGFYQVSNSGQIRGLNRIVKRKGQEKQLVRSRIMVPSHGKTSPYFQIKLCKNSIGRNSLVHRLIAQAFLPEWNPALEVNHKDGNKFNNRVENLEMCTRRENLQHAIDNCLKRDYGENHVHAKLTNADATEIRRLHGQGILQVELARQFHVCKQTICSIVNHKTYRHANSPS